MALKIPRVRSHKTTKRLAALVPAGVLTLGLFFSVGAWADTSQVTVTPTNTQGWYNADTRGDGEIQYIEDATSPYPSGALQLTTTNDNADKAQYMKSASVPLADINELSYYTKQNSGPAVAAPSYQLEVDLNGDEAGGFTTLVYEPYWNGAVIPGTWQSWDVDAGQFWSSKTVAPLVVNGAGGPPFYTLNQLKLVYPNAVVTAFGVNIGSFNPNYDVETDGVNFNGTTYDFELKAASATSKDECKNGGWMNFTTEYKNQGQCVSSVNHSNGVGVDDTATSKKNQ